jgi:hypothetical protein
LWSLHNCCRIDCSDSLLDSIKRLLHVNDVDAIAPSEH